SVTALAAAPGRLWVGTDKGGMALDTRGVWRPFLAGTRIYDAQAGRSRVYLGTDAGLYGLDMNGEVREHRTQANSSLASNSVYRVLPVGRDVWALTQQGVRLVMRDAGEAEADQDPPAPARGPDSVVLVVNDNAPESLRVAMRYVETRGTPKENICHLRCPKGEVVSWEEFEASIRKPLARFLLETGLARRASYLVTTYGVPLRISARPAPDAMMTEGASVDSELCLVARDHALRGPLPNRYLYRDEPFNPARFGMFLVTRLDGPTAEAAMGLIDSAALAEQAQTFGRRGFAYFDLSPEQNRVGGGGVDESMMANYRWMERESQMRPRLRLESTDREMDEPNECPAAFFYMGRGAGIYHKRTFTWLHGAVGVHIHALSARSLRRPDQSWLAAAVQNGLAAGIGTVAQPGAMGVNTMNSLYRYLHAGYNWAESAYMSTRWLSWQTVVVGDPLYRPFQ
ncbi:MAG TPA: TIGR03790 family protein, partial [Candidatus Brocadiia bacterium]|nr:TIGR03790 family protein [Candidatus Brocadiia bacterium]